MGQASRKLANRFRHSRRCTQGLRKQAKHDAVRIPQDVRNIQHLVAHEGYDPLHAAYISAQNLLSFFAESVSTFEEFDAYCDIVGAAEDAYMPGGPPLSPITVSYFTTWAWFDVRFGPDQETIGTCLLDVAELVGMDPLTLETVQNFQAWSRAMCSSAMSLRATWERQANSGTSVVAHPFAICSTTTSSLRRRMYSPRPAKPIGRLTSTSRSWTPAVPTGVRHCMRC